MKKAEIIIASVGLLALGVMAYLLATRHKRTDEVLSGRLLYAPQCLTVDARGHLYVANEARRDGGALVAKVSPKGQVSVCADRLPHVSALAADAQGNLYAATGLGEVLKITPDGTAAKALQDIPTGECSLAFDPQGRLHVVNSRVNVIYRVAENGRPEPLEIGCFSAGGMAFDRAGNLFIVSKSPGLVLKFEAGGEARVFADVRGATCLAMDRLSHLYVGAVDSLGGTVYRLDPSGRTKSVVARKVGRVRSLALSPNGTLYVSSDMMGGVRAIHVGTPGLILP
ncbi:MAG: hypothetical protein FJ279_24385 [Planctomycetes bacterium]|nr:hypothetical protein [Planctomycetota bacterium]